MNRTATCERGNTTAARPENTPLQKQHTVMVHIVSYIAGIDILRIGYTLATLRNREEGKKEEEEPVSKRGRQAGGSETTTMKRKRDKKDRKQRGKDEKVACVEDRTRR